MSSSKRIVIEQSGRTIRHEIGDDAVVIGRDPSCDLFFADRRLSRKHCRFEPTGTGVRFVDLDSRNGSWVNRKKTREVDLASGDVIRIGALTITYEQESPAPEPSPPPASVEAPADEDETVLLGADRKAESGPSPSDTARFPGGAAAAQADRTVALPSAGGGIASADKTRIMPREGPPTPSPGGAATRILTPGDLEAALPSPPVPGSGPPSDSEVPAPPEPPGKLAGLPWTSRFLLITSLLALTVYLFLAFPLVRTLGNTLRAESLRRGRALLELLAANSGAPVGEGRTRDLSVDGVLREERVKGAVLLDLEGKVLAPSSRSGETLSRLDGIDAPIADIRTFYLGRVSGGDYVMVQPLVHRGRRVGLAVVTYEAASASGGWTAAILFLAFLVALLGVLVSLVLAKRMTLAPVTSLRDDVEAIVKGDVEKVPLEQGFHELSDVAKSINRLIDRKRQTARASRPKRAASAPAEPAPPPGAPIPSPPPPKAQGSPAAPPSVSASAGAPPSAPAPPSSPGGCRLWADENFLVVRAEREAAEILGTAGASIEGQHLIEAVKDQKLLEAILDAVNGLGATDPSTARADVAGGGCEVTASREGTGVVVGLRRL